MAPVSLPLARSMSDEFDSLNTILGEEVDRTAALAAENAALRQLLAARDAADSSAPDLDSAAVDAGQLRRELVLARAAQDALQREVGSLRTAQATIAAAAALEDRADECDVLRHALATLAEQLAAEKERAVAHEERQRVEEDKVAMLRSKVEESRRALMRIQGETSRKNSTAEYSLSALSARRASHGGGGLLDSAAAATRRRSSAGFAPGAAGGLGLGLDSSFGRSGPARRSFSSQHRRGSASVSGLDTPGEEDRVARLRDLRYGNTNVKCNSRRNSSLTGIDLAGDLDYAPARYRVPSVGHLPATHDEPLSRPPSAPLRNQGRKHSTAVFDDWSRRSSLDSHGAATDLFAPFLERGSSSGSSGAPSTTDLLFELENLRVQLAESEEGRLASETCLRALKQFITSPADGELEAGLRLPPLPTDADPDDDAPAEHPKRASVSRWGLPRLPSLSRRESAGASPNLTTFAANPRRQSSSSNASSSTAHVVAVDRSSVFGGFSFSRVASAPVVCGGTPYTDEDTSPTMAASASFRRPDESDSEGAGARAPSLTDSCASSESSRSSSPVVDSPDLALDDSLVTICSLDEFGGPERVRVPAVLVDGKTLLLSPIGETCQFGALP